MNYYYVSKRPLFNGEHEVHKLSCYRLPAENERVLLGYLKNGTEAVAKAKTMYKKVNACFNCCNEYHSCDISIDEDSTIGSV
jgi:hypothetical protein